MTEKIIAGVLLVLAFVALCVGYYFYVKSKINAAVSGSINDVENLDINGEAKKAEAVAQLSALVPAVLKPFISEKMLDAIVQAAFDKIESYAKIQIKKKTALLDGDSAPSKSAEE